MKPNIIDRAISYVAPGLGARRLVARAKTEIMTRGYDGATRGRTNNSWKTNSSSADAEIGKAGPLLRDRMRDLVRNNPHAANAVSGLVDYTLGTGIRPRIKNRKVAAAFDAWAKQCDASGCSDFYGLQALVLRQMLESGDGLVRRRFRRDDDGLAVPLQIQVMEADYLDSSKTGPLTNGNRAVQGVELNKIGQRTAYWMFQQHPGDVVSYGTGYDSRPVPASEVLHVFERQREQTRGTPWGAPSMPALYALAEYERAELVRKNLEACMVGVMTGGDTNDAVGAQAVDANGAPMSPGVYDVHGAQIEKFEPGMIYNAVGGRDMKFTQPSVNVAYEAYKTSMLHTIAAGFRVPHAVISGNLREVNYSSSKVGLEHFRLTIEYIQWNILVPMLLEPLWRWFCDAAYGAGLIPSADIPVEWAMPKFPSADPARDTNATVAAIRAGLISPQRAIAETGYSPDEVLAEFVEWNKKLDAAGVKLDSDPRNMSQAGQTQQPVDDTSGDAKEPLNE